MSKKKTKPQLNIDTVKVHIYISDNNEDFVKKQGGINKHLGPILDALSKERNNSLIIQTISDVESREYAIAQGRLEGIDKAINIVKEYFISKTNDFKRP